MSLDSTPEEVAATVAAYLRMLTMELTGQVYNKSEHRRALHQLLPDRSEGAIEFKHSNVSADGEHTFANSHELEFRLYRVFEFHRAPRLVRASRQIRSSLPARSNVVSSIVRVGCRR